MPAVDAQTDQFRGARVHLCDLAVLEEDAPYHPLGLPHGGMPPDAGSTPKPPPTLDEVLAPRLARMATMRRVVDGLTEAEHRRYAVRDLAVLEAAASTG